VAAGAVTGSLVGLGVSEGWFGSAAAAALPTSVAGAAAIGGVAGVGTIALIHAATTPCQGFHALFGGLFTTSEGCVNGQWVGYGAPPPAYDGPPPPRGRARR
jgi:hypothetical protein